MNRVLSFAGVVLLLGACGTSGKIQKTQSDGPALPAFNKEGHRGTRGWMPENSIEAMIRGIDLGANSIECDVAISKDNKVVVSHDIYMNADFTLTPEGREMSKKDGLSRLVYDMPYDSIRKYDIGSKGNTAFPDQKKIRAYKPLLAEMIDAVDAYLKKTGKFVIYNIELKANAEWDGKKQPQVEELVDRTMAVVKEKQLLNRCYLQSFDFRAMRLIHEKYPEYTTAILIGGSEKRSLDEQLADLGYIPQMYSPSFSLVTPELVAACHAKGMKLIPWTVNEAADIARMKQLGVDGIITDYPDRLN